MGSLTQPHTLKAPMDGYTSPGDTTTSADRAAPAWRPLSANERRVLGVLVEKAKTTPDAYPMSLNALRNGCNQKNNRFPQTQLEEHHVEAAIEGLRKAGAVSIIQGDGRVEKYRHLAYEWMGVEKAELAVMAELLLRGAQTVGELRGRAARMEPIRGQDELVPLLRSLRDKRLIVNLTHPGRGAVVTHNLYQPQELEKVRREHGEPSDALPSEGGSPADAPAPIARSPATQAAEPEPPIRSPRAGDDSDLRAELAALRVELSTEVLRLRDELDDLRRQLGA